ncbi:TolC family protein [Dyella psychrodurans]|uniref:TolC family protein n=1 Tax=Dyella psychrodurans TaxID=1927960 RepID=A0A370XCA2_9GAMM|nr:TolC family protein [Dyella psychrodurans]RDS86016.1 TolC family protein [Dyella psychrodurans]
MRAGVLGGVLVFAGCATYSPLPLGDGQGVKDASQLTVNAADMPLPALRTHTFDPSHGLDVTDVAMLAVANNPDLRLLRDQLGIARAQAFQAGLLPDPQISINQEFLDHAVPGYTTSYAYGISEDITSLLLRSTRKAAANSQADQVNLELLWAEWQTIAQARLLFNQVVSLRLQQHQLADEQTALAPVDTYVRKALLDGNLTHDTASPGINAYADASKRLSDCTVQLHQAEHDLRLLLGLAPDASLDLIGEPFQASPTAEQMQTALSDLPKRRPDLLALQAGYKAQEATLRGAIRAQFPALSLGVDRQSDNSGVLSHGINIGFTLPLFDRNRGNIRIETATRQQLKDDYEDRVLTTRNDITQLTADLETLSRQRDQLQIQSARMDEARRAAEAAWQKGLLDWPTYLSIRANALSADMDYIAACDQQSQQAIALETLLGDTDLQPPSSSPSKS